MPLSRSGLRAGSVALALLAGIALGAGPAQAMDVQIVNRSGQPASRVYVMLDNGSSSDGQLASEQPKKLSALTNQRFTLSSLAAGRIFFSYGSPVTAAEPPQAPIRYDKVELTYPGVANLTAVDFFGIPFKLQALNAGGRPLGSLGFTASSATVRKALLKIPGARGAQVKTASGGFARVLSPQLSPQSYPSFGKDIASMVGRTVTIAGKFFGTPYQEFSYTGTFAADGAITLNGTITAPNGGAAAAALPLAVTGPGIASAIYTVDGAFTVGGQPATVSDNTVYSAIYRDLLSGFAWGYMGGRYGDDSASWFTRPPFAAARKSKTSYATYNEYAAVINRYSDAYGFAFSDTGPKNVQLPLTGAATLRITILR